MKGIGLFTRVVVIVIAGTLIGCRASAEDLIEFADGSKLNGTITSIRKAEKEFDFTSSENTADAKSVYRFAEVHAVTYKGKRFILTPKPVDGSAAVANSGDSVARSKAQVLEIIADAGATPPDWFDATPLNYPKTLDLSWPIEPPKGPWQSNKNMGQYVWSVINENPGRWHSGIKLIHHCVALHKDDRVLVQRDMAALGMAYFRLLQDYPRAAFWLQKGNVSVGKIDGIRLAECYWRLGNRQMALDMLRGQRLNMAAIKLYGDMGELDRSLSLTKAFAKSGADYQANILAADALRLAGRLDEAIDYYEQVIASKNFRNDEYEKRFKARAQESIDSIRLYDQADISKVADGTYRDSSTGYNGKLSVEVAVAAGRLQSVKITNHKEKQFYSSLTDTPAQLIKRQSVQGIDGTSGATITAQAIVNATAKALAKGTR